MIGSEPARAEDVSRAVPGLSLRAPASGISLRMKPAYLVRYGTMSHVARFVPESEGESYGRGQSVVVRTERGLEIGEVLGPPRVSDAPPSPYSIVRAASDLDRQKAAAQESPRIRLLAVCDEVFRDGTWPIDLIDVEVLPPLGEEGPGAVVHYLGPHRLDTEGLAEALLKKTGISVLFQPAGLDGDDIEEPAPETCSRCGSGGGGGCGSEGAEAHSGCSSCALASLPRRKTRAVV